MTAFGNKRVLVTGSAGIVGQAVAKAFHDAGGIVTGIDIRTHEAPWRTVVADLTDPADAKNTLEAIGAPDILANIAGGFAMGDTVADTSDETWDFMMDLNAGTVLNACRAAVPGMIARGRGKIVNMGARAALRGAAAMGAYVASKSVVVRLTETLADELKHRRINVNCILPSIIDTPRNRADMPDADFDAWVPPEQIAGVVLFLASPAADCIHGASIPVEALA